MKSTEIIGRPAYIKRIRPFINTDLIKVITGIRRCGKSIMLNLIQKELQRKGIKKSQIIDINFENLDYAHLLNGVSLHKEMSKRINANETKKYIFFDEIQEVENWEKCINSLRVKFNCDIYITGSNAKLLSGELATHLSGRYVEQKIFPFSFAEFATHFPGEDKNAVFMKYINFGGMPYLWNLRYEENSCREYLSNLYASIILKDIIRRNKIRDIDLLERVVKYVIANAGNTFSASSIAKFLKNEKRSATVDTILNYIKFCENSFLCYKARRQNIQGKKILTTQEKFYIADHGFRQAIFYRNKADINLVLENIVYLELLRRGFDVYVGETKNCEIDFVAQKGEQIEYFQVAYILSSKETINREFGAFDLVADNFSKYVLSMDNFDFSRNGIVHKNLINWLLESKY